MQFYRKATIWLTLAFVNLPGPTEPLNCDKEFTYFENYGQNGFNVSCNEISKGYEHMLENITISNEVALILSNSTLENVTSNLFNRLGKIKTLSIINSNLSFGRSVSPFTKLVKLETLVIENTNFSVYEATFKSLSRVKYLILSNNSLAQIEKGGFKTLENLERLEVTNNKIKDLEDLKLCELPKLKYLNLHLNNISTKRLFSFSCQKSSNSLDFTVNTNSKTLPVFNRGSYFNISDTTLDLVDLNLSSNQIVDLGHLLDELNTLLRLNLAFNKLISIKSSSFGSVNKLEKIILSNNLLNNIDNEVFVNKLNLKYLDLSHNQLNYVNISNLPKLEFLDLGHNNLHNVYIRNLTKLNYLNLDYNKLPNLGPQFFKKVPSLTSLKLCGNQVVLKRNFFKEVPMLEILVLNNNSLANLPNLTFSGLNYLRILDLSINNLSSIVRGAFSDLLNLEVLNLSHNALEKLDYDDVQELRSLTTLDLTNNKLITIEYDIILSNLKSLSTVYIRENFLTCNVLENMISFVKRRGITFTVSEKMEFNSENVAGIPCIDPVVKTSPIIKDKSASEGGGSVVFNLGIGVVSVFIILLAGIISYRAYIYLKRRLYKADEFELLDG